MSRIWPPHAHWNFERWPLMWPSMYMELALIDKKWQDAVAPLIEAARESGRITAADLAVTINARDY